MTYKFQQFNIEIVNPTIEINPIVKDVNPIDPTRKDDNQMARFKA